jgi:hypothetical protein
MRFDFFAVAPGLRILMSMRVSGGAIRGQLRGAIELPNLDENSRNVVAPAALVG